MRYRIVSGEAGNLRGIIVLEATGYSVTSDGTLIVTGEGGKIIEYAASSWRSITDIALFDKAFQGGSGDEAPRRTRQITAANP